MALVLGWFHANPHHLMKYVSLYQQLGIDTMYATMPTRCVLFPHWLLFPVIHQLRMELWNEMRRQSHPQTDISDDGPTLSPDQTSSLRPLIVHTFSGNGAVAYALMHDEKPFPNVIGCIHDSGPVFLNSKIMAIGFLAGLNEPMSHHPPPWIFKLINQFWDLGSHQVMMEYIHERLKKLPVCKTLVIGGKSDHVVTPKDLNLFTSQCLKTYEMKWFDSGHVNHLQSNPEEYRKIVNQFVESLR
jgi:hypothetical protein